MCSSWRFSKIEGRHTVVGTPLIIALMLCVICGVPDVCVGDVTGGWWQPMMGEDSSTKVSPAGADESRAVDDFPALPDTPPSQLNRRPRVCIATSDLLGPIRNGGVGTASAVLAEVLASAGHHVTLLYAGPVRTGRRAPMAGSLPAAPNRLRITVGQPDGARGLASRSGVVPGLRMAQATAAIRRGAVSRYRRAGFYSMQAKRLGLAFMDDSPCTSCCTALRCGTGSKIASRSTTSRICALEHLERRSIEWADALVSPSRDPLDWVKDWGFRLPAQVFVHPYASHRTEFRAGTAALRSRRSRSSAASKRAKAWKSSVRLWRFSRSEARSTGVQSRFSANPGVPGSKMERPLPRVAPLASASLSASRWASTRPERWTACAVAEALGSHAISWPTTRRTPFSSALQRRYRLSPPAPAGFRKLLPSPIEKTRSLLQRQGSWPSASSVHSATA